MNPHNLPSDAEQQQMVDDMGPATVRELHQSEPGGDIFKAGSGDMVKWIRQETSSPSYQWDLKIGTYIVRHPSGKPEVVLAMGISDDVPCPACKKTHESAFVMTSHYWALECSRCKKVFWVMRNIFTSQTIDEKLRNLQ